MITRIRDERATLVHASLPAMLRRAYGSSSHPVLEKLDDYAASHIPLVWVIDPKRRTVMVIDADVPVRWLRDGDTLDGGRIVQGFACPVSELFAGTD